MLNSSNKSSIFNLDNITEKITDEDWPYRKLIIGPSGSGKKIIYYAQFKKTII